MSELLGQSYRADASAFYDRNLQTYARDRRSKAIRDIPTAEF